jgi:phosphoglycolate phosphatase
MSAVFSPLPKMVLIDLDGTLVDSVPDLSFCVNEMLREIGRPEVTETKARDWVGNGVERLVKRALTNTMEDDPEKVVFDQAMPFFMDCYQKNTCVNSVLYDGVAEALAWMEAEGFLLACVTNKAATFTHPLLETMGIMKYFKTVVSGDTLAYKKPRPEPLWHAAEQLGVSAAESLMVGDSTNDVTAARSAGFPVACVTYGYNHGKDIRDAKPDAVMDSLLDLTRLLRSAP